MSTPSRAELQALRRHCRVTAPEVFFASHFLSRDRRVAVYAIAAVVRQLRDVLVPAVAVQPAGLEASGCSTCGEETPEQRREVAHAVMDFLYSGQKTGKPELDAFQEVADRSGIGRDAFGPLIDGLSLHATLRRYPTWKRFRDVCNQTAGSVGLMLWRALSDSPSGPDATAREQVLAFAAACRMCVVLTTLGDELAANRVPVPLDDLVKFAIRESELRSFAAARTTAGDPRWVELMRFEVERIRKLYHGGVGCLAALPPAARRAVTVYGESHLALLDRLAAQRFDPFVKPIRGGMWERLRRLPRAAMTAGRAGVRGA